MKETITYATVLAVFTLVAGLALAVTYSFSQPLIDAQKGPQTNAALASLIPDATRFEQIPGGYRAYAGTTLSGCVFTASKQGYKSQIQSLVAVGTDGTIRGIAITSQEETVGLGTRIVEVAPGETSPWFTAQFAGKKASDLALTKDGGTIDAVTGATISSRAVLDSVKAAAAQECR